MIKIVIKSLQKKIDIEHIEHTGRTYLADTSQRSTSMNSYKLKVMVIQISSIVLLSQNVSVYNEKERPCPQHVFSFPYDTPFKIETQTYNFVSIKSKSKVSFSLNHSQKLNYKLMPDFHEYRFDKTEQE